MHDVRILKPGFSVVSSEYVVGLLAPRHAWTLQEPDASTAEPVRRVATSS